MPKIVIGIGNPDPEYQDTRHNVGWAFLDWLAKKYDFAGFKENRSDHTLSAKGSIEKAKVVLAKPLTYVNNSGQAAAKLKNFYKAKPEDIIVIQDDLDIPFGSVKLSFDRNSGGHRGIESVIKSLKTKKFWRIRIGTAVRSLDKARQQTDKKRDEFVRGFVLKPFTPSERDELKDIFKAALLRLEQIL